PRLPIGVATIWSPGETGSGAGVSAAACAGLLAAGPPLGSALRSSSLISEVTRAPHVPLPRQAPATAAPDGVSRHAHHAAWRLHAEGSGSAALAASDRRAAACRRRAADDLAGRRAAGAGAERRQDPRRI